MRYVLFVVRNDEMRGVRPLTAQVAEQMQAILADKDFSQARIAQELGRVQSFVSVRLSGKKPLSTDDIDAIATVIGMTGEELLTEIADRLNPDALGIVTPIRPNDSGGRHTPLTEDEAYEEDAVAKTGVKEVREFDDEEDPHI